MVKAVLEAFPEAAGRALDSGYLPLHLCFEGKASLEVVEMVAKAYPEGLARV